MVPFLKGFLSNLTAVQSKQILRIIGQMRDRGEIRDAKDFETKLAALALLIQKGELTQRTPFLFFQEGELLESDAMISFVEYLQLDIEASLGETERLSNSMRAHNRILTENYFDAIEASVSKLEADTRAYEILEAQKFIGFSVVKKTFTFDGPSSVSGADPSDPIVESLFKEGRGRESLILSPPHKGENGIHLGIDENGSVSSKFDNISIFTDSTTPQTSINTATAENTPVKAIDGSKDTGWRHSVLLSERVDYCRLILSVSFVGAKRISALVLHPVSDVAMKIHSVSYVNSGGQETDLSIGSAYTATASLDTLYSSPLGETNPKADHWILPNVKKIIPVGDIVAKSFTITLQQDTAKPADFHYYDTDLGNWVAGVDVTSSMQGRPQTDGAEVARELGFLDDDENNRSKGQFEEYVFGFKEISAVTYDFKTNGLFVPESFSTSSAPNVLALYTDIEYPRSNRSDVEFLLLKQNYDSNNMLLDVETIPLLSYGDSFIDERLFLTEKQISNTTNDTGILRFYPDFDSSFNVYRDETLLVLGTDYTISVDDAVTFESVVPPVTTPLNPPVCHVLIVAPQSGVLYTVSYTPLVSTSEAGGEVWLNSERTVRLGRYQTYVFNNQRSNGVVDNCKIGLQIIVRANTLNTKVSPYLREAILLGG